MVIGWGTTGFFAQFVPDVGDVVDTTDVSTWDPLWAGVAVVVGVVLAYLARIGTRRWAHRARLPPNMVGLSVTLVTWAVVAVSVLFAFSLLGLSVTWFWLAALLLLVTFVVGGRALMESFGAGVMLQARAPFRPGDLVRVGESMGVVHEVNSRVVILDSVDGQRLFLPNQLVLHEPIVNLTFADRRMSMISLDVAYGTDLERARTVATSALADAPGVLGIPEPVAEVASFEASAVRIRLRFWHPPDLLSEWAAVDAASRAVYEAYDADGIQFAFPQQTLWWGEGREETDR